MSSRRVTALAAVLLVLSGGVAHAATRAKPKPICNLVTDKTGDPLSTDSSLDVVSADVASNGRQVTAVFRVAKLPETDPLTPAGRYYELRWTYNGVGYQIQALLTPAGNQFYGVGSTRASKGSVDYAKGEIHVTVDVDTFPGHPQYKPGTLMTNFIVHADEGTPVFPFPMTFTIAGDEAIGTRAYPVGAASCVKVGA